MLLLHFELVFALLKAKRSTNPWRQVTMETRFRTVTGNIFYSLVWNLLYVTILAPKILRFVLDFLKICEPLLQPVKNVTAVWDLKTCTFVDNY